MKSTKIKTKTEKGITLIALIITIVVLMILAAVAINSITNDGIIGKAESVKNTYTEAQNEEQKLLDYYELVLAQKAWTQNGTTVTRGNVKFEVGDTISGYSVDGYTGEWRVLGAEYGKLLLVSRSSVLVDGEYGITLGGADGYLNGVNKLNAACAVYKNEEYADLARSINVEDINRVTEFNPEGYSDYGTSYTFTENMKHPDGREIGKNGVESITVIDTEYSGGGGLSTPLSQSSRAAITLFLESDNLTTPSPTDYWLASTFEDVRGTDFICGLRTVESGLNWEVFWAWLPSIDMTIGDDGSVWKKDVRAVVSIKPDIVVNQDGTFGTKAS